MLISLLPRRLLIGLPNLMRDRKIRNHAYNSECGDEGNSLGCSPSKISIALMNKSWIGLVSDDQRRRFLSGSHRR